MPKNPVIAYLTSTYARASDTFIRSEVNQLRRLGHTVHTFSIRRPAPSEVVSDNIRDERAQTAYILVRENLAKIAAATFRTLLFSPRTLASTAGLALRCSPRSVKSWGKALGYVIEACFLAEQLRPLGVNHLHNHFGEGSALVAMLTSALTGIPYSLTIHGPGEFDHPATLALDEKVARAAFTVAVSDYGRSQLLRWIRLDDWAKVKVVHCGIDERFRTESALPIDGERRLVCVGRLVAEKYSRPEWNLKW